MENTGRTLLEPTGSRLTLDQSFVSSYLLPEQSVFSVTGHRLLTVAENGRTFSKQKTSSKYFAFSLYIACLQTEQIIFQSVFRPSIFY